jgi:hypothetical protein
MTNLFCVFYYSRPSLEICLEFSHSLGLQPTIGRLFQASMLFIGLIFFLLLQPILTTAPFLLTDVVVIFTIGMICFIPFALFMRGVV